MKISAKLVALTQPVIGTPAANSEALIAYCARVSNPSNQDNPDYSKLLDYCIRNKHWSVFEMANAIVEVAAPRDITRQLLRHRSFCFQEFSQRYSDEIEFTDREFRRQDDKNRQNSVPLDMNSDEGRRLAYQWQQLQQGVIDKCKDAYEWAIEHGIAKEQARAVLPEGLTTSRMYMNGTIRSWIHYIQTRAGNGTQQEHMDIALECAKAITEIFPMAESFVSN